MFFSQCCGLEAFCERCFPRGQREVDIHGRFLDRRVACFVPRLDLVAVAFWASVSLKIRHRRGVASAEAQDAPTEGMDSRGSTAATRTSSLLPVSVPSPAQPRASWTVSAYLHPPPPVDSIRCTSVFNAFCCCRAQGRFFLFRVVRALFNTKTVGLTDATGRVASKLTPREIFVLITLRA